MAAVQRREERFSGHESFVCRYGWLPKLHNAVANDPFALKDEAGFYPISTDGLIRAENFRSCRATLRRIRGL